MVYYRVAGSIVVEAWMKEDLRLPPDDIFRNGYV